MYESGLEACRLDLYTDADELFGKYPDLIAKKVLRIREMHQWMINNPAAKDSKFIAEEISRFAISRQTAYSDLFIIKSLLPAIAASSRDFNRWRYIEMILRTYELAEARKDVRTMERAASSLARYTNIDKEEEAAVPLDKVPVQPFVATDDPSVLGIEYIPNIRERQKSLLDKYIKECADIEDIEAEDADLEEDELFPDIDES